MMVLAGLLLFDEQAGDNIGRMSSFFLKKRKKTLDHSLLLNYVSTHDGQIGHNSWQFEESKKKLCVRKKDCKVTRFTLITTH
jgi:hypothetical protein